MKRFFGLPWAAAFVVTAILALFGVTRVFGDATPSASAAPVAQQIGMRILLITDSTDATTPSGIAYGDWVNTLTREGVQYQTMVTSDASPGSVALPALSSTLPDGTQVSNYEGVVVATSGTEGMTTAQWDTLQTFEHQFSVRQVTAYAVPSSDYGLSAPNPVGGGVLAPTTALTLTADGTTVFPYLNQVSLDPTQSTWAYEATPSPAPGESVDTLISGPGGTSLLGIFTSSDGRQTMYQTFNENQYYLQSELLRHGELDWVTRNTFFGDQRNYLEMDIDDTFTPDDAWDATTTPGSIDYNEADDLRMNTGDVATASTWEANNNFRMDQLFNMGGTAAYQADNGGSDPLLAAFQATCSSNCGPGNGGAGKSYANSFGWISHTYDTPYLDVGCATQNYIEAELNENSDMAAETGSGGTGGLGLTEDNTGTTALGAEDPHVFVPGNHSGFANLVPGNPATVDPPILDAATAGAASSGTLPAGYYEYAVSDQFVNSSTAGQSSADVVAVPTEVPADGSVSLTWQDICHAADYVIYRGYNATTAAGPFTWTQLAPATGSTTGEIGAVSTPFDPTSADTNNPTSTSDVTNGGEPEETFPDTGTTAACATSCPTPPTTENAVESPWEQNEWFGPALAAVGITAVGDDGSKPYPDPANDEFGIGVSYTGAEYPADSTFVVPGTSAQVVPRHPVNIYYNASTDYQELNEYQSIYGSNGSTPDTAVCPTGTCTWSNVVDQVVSGMFAFLMNNDPRPSYVHQTNIMGTPPAASETPGTDLPPASYTPEPGGGPDEPAGTGNPTTTGDGTLYQVLDPLLAQYREYFNSTAPIEQLTEQQIAALLAEQSAWASSTAVSGYIEGNTVVVSNNGAGIEIPLTGVENVGSPYAGTQSGWTEASTGTSTYTALATWPAEPTNPVVLTPPTGPAPGGTLASGGNPNPPAPTAQSKPKLYYEAVQVAPKTVSMKAGTATVSLKCEAKNGKAAKNHFCTGSFTLKVMGKKVTDSFKIKATKTARITVKLPKKAVAAATSGKPRTLHGALTISTKQPKGAPKVTRGTLNIKT
ncbi:MAG TPA: hypothetical protein VEF89_13835 [Solirubrobacteraceae bacterium]|nr:hypothetical protein [Solirubrobacteraceae bacterium]